MSLEHLASYSEIKQGGPNYAISRDIYVYYYY